MCLNAPPAVCDEEVPVVMSCKKCGSVDLIENHRFWFRENLTLVSKILHDILHTTSSSQIISAQLLKEVVGPHNSELGGQ